MTFGSELRLIAEGAEPVRPPPEVLARSIVVPPGLPWDQAQAARLEARHGAPLPMADLAFQLKRLEGWRPGGPGRFAAFYVLARDLSGRLETTVEVDGRDLSVTFLSADLQRQRVRWLASVGIASGVAAALLVFTVGTALMRRAEAEAGLSALETRADGKLRAVQARERLKEQTRALDAQLNRGARLGDVLGAIAGASSAKSPDAHIEGFHWEPGLVAVEVRGTQAPFDVPRDQVLRKSAKPVRRGVWLWGLTPRPAALTEGSRPPSSSPDFGGAERP
jgi:hypothetical protein